jgi:hypothetical protein
MYHGVGEVEQQWITEYFRDESMGNWAGLGAVAPGDEQASIDCVAAGGHWNLISKSCEQREQYSTLRTVYEVAGVAGAAAGAYHGYKRNNGSVGWAIGWFFFGSLVPWLALPIMFAEGFGKRKQ